MALCCDPRAAEMKVMTHHFQRGVSEYLLKREYIHDLKRLLASLYSPQ